MSICPRCGTAFSCGMVDGTSKEPCWCARLPALAAREPIAPEELAGRSCLCPNCLRVRNSAKSTQ